MRKLYKPNRKDWLAIIWIAIPVLLLLLMVFNYREVLHKPYLAWAVLYLGFTLWRFYDLSYSIEEGNFCYRFGYKKQRIPIAKIRSIKPGKFSWVGDKATLASKGIFIQFNKYDDILISPANPEKFMDDLLKVNPSIEVTGFGQKEKV